MGKVTSSASSLIKTKNLFQRLWRWATEPSPKITERDQRRQAGLLSGLLLVLILGAALVEVITVLLINQPDYTGYRDTIVGICILAIVYSISRTQYLRLASILMVFLAMLAIFATGWSQPYGVLGGFLDYLILPLWLGSLYLNLKEIVAVIIVEILGLLLFPLLVSEITFNDILIGPFSFVFIMSILLIVITRHRNRLEQDRNTDLIEKEKQSRREAARAEALLRVTARLNAQLDLEALLSAICEEVTRALNTPVSLVALYDQKQSAFYSVTATGLTPALVKSMAPFPRALYEETTTTFGKVFGLPDMQLYPNLPNFELLKELDMRSIAFATMEYEQEIIGSLTAITLGESRHFTEDELLLLQRPGGTGVLSDHQHPAI